MASHWQARKLRDVFNFFFNFNVLNTSAHVTLRYNNSVSGWKCALVNPGLDFRYKNFRPISILQYVSKLVERAVFDKRMDARLRTTPNQVLNYHIVLVTVPKGLCWRLWVTSFFPWIHNVSRFLYYYTLVWRLTMSTRRSSSIGCKTNLVPGDGSELVQIVFV